MDDIENMAQWIKFKGLFGSNLGVINIYVPNSTLDHYRLWEQILLKLP
jgi:hypothetical protein